MSLRPFHIAVPVQDLAEARAFYTGLLGCTEGRSSSRWVDFNLYGHQYVCHKTDKSHRRALPTNEVDGASVPVPHCGVVLGWEEWEALAERLRAAGLRFAIEPSVRFPGQPGEQATMFFYDPFGNALEFKAMRDPDRLFARQAE